MKDLRFGTMLAGLAVLLVLGGSLGASCHKQPVPPAPAPVAGAGQAGAAGAGGKATGGSLLTAGAGGARPGPEGGAGGKPPLPPLWNAGDPCSSTFALLDWAGCPPAGPGDAGTWVGVCQFDRTQGIKFVPPERQACLAKAKTKAAIRACGVSCP